MDVTSHFNALIPKKIRYTLVFFCMLNLVSCKKEATKLVVVNYSEGKAVSVSLSNDIGNKGFDVYLKGVNAAPVLGNFSSEGNRTTFIPVVPFETGKTYLLSQGKKTAEEFTIKENPNTVQPELLAMYPTSDTVPQNLLKMYFIFSQPMQEVGKALDFVSVTHLETQENVSVFLDLPTELWDDEHTQLTLWLDPGRIKTGLIPNKEKGLPIIEGNHYEIKISAKWKSAQGVPLGEDYVKQITVVRGDYNIPNLTEWEIRTPGRGTKEPLRIHFGESMDAMLGEPVLSFSSTSDSEKLKGEYRLLEQERVLEFIPEMEWGAGRYSMIATRHLEDLAGNTPMHLFDTEVTKDSEDMKHEKYIDSRTFTIE